MAFCRICERSTKEKNVEVNASTLMNTFIICIPCRKSTVLSKISKVAPRTKAAQDALEKAENARRDLAYKAPNQVFKILVWGPSPFSADPAAQKRIELKERLTELGHKVFFSEDFSPIDSTFTNVAEAYQLSEADLVINIAASFGSIGEAHELMPGVGKKGLLWLADSAKEGFIGSGLAHTINANGTKVEYYDNRFIDCCAIVAGSLFYIDTMIALENMGNYYMQMGQEMKVLK